MKTFLLVTPQQSEKNLEKLVYQPVDNPDLAFGSTCFPGIPLINAHVEAGDKIHVVTVTYDSPDCRRNLSLLDEEIASVCSENDAEYALESIEAPFDDSIQAILGIYQQLIARFEDGDELYADITFGSKPMPIVLIMALQYAYRTKRDSPIECVVYGQVSHFEQEKTARIYDVTALVQLDEIVRLMADGSVEDPKRVIDLIIGK